MQTLHINMRKTYPEKEIRRFYDPNSNLTDTYVKDPQTWARTNDPTSKAVIVGVISEGDLKPNWADKAVSQTKHIKRGHKHSKRV